ncbi:MAG TPA: protein translocase subunit SecF [Vicinamibacterales bacterium]|jgi:preprotein translocase subunit SecF|nr:protein translocase subunit SecF [Vicinamibacterales bacterium]
MHIFKNTHYDFLRWRWHAIALSLAIVIAGGVTIATRGLAKGVEFAGGTVVIEQFEQPVTVEQVRDAVTRYYPGGGEIAIVQAYGDPSLRMMMIRVAQVGAEAGASLGDTAQHVEDALKQGNVGPFQRQGAEIVSATVGRELTTKGIWATVLSLVGILAYISFRFQFSFAIGAVVATIHDLAVTLSFLAFFGYDMTLNVIAALLTIAGYSTNDTIVIFDRVRENQRGMRRERIDSIINIAINQTLGRTVITAGTALLSALALFFFGGDVLHGFAFTLVVGLLAGTYSTVFIAAAIVSFWRSATPGRAATRAPATSSQQPPRRSKPQRKAKAS